jgi:uncharacterized Zn finger protein
MLCQICGGALRAAHYKVRDEHEPFRMILLPASECEECGSIEPDSLKISEMPEANVPSSVRLRCAIARRADR